LFIQCSAIPNGDSVTSSKDLYNYRAYLETLLTYGHDASLTHLVILVSRVRGFSHNPPTDSPNRGHYARRKLTNKSSEIEMYGRVYGYLFNVPRLLTAVVQIQLKFANSKSDLYVLGSKSITTAVFKFLEATLHV
jgi:hypothetical protein